MYYKVGDTILLENGDVTKVLDYIPRHNLIQYECYPNVIFELPIVGKFSECNPKAKVEKLFKPMVKFSIPVHRLDDQIYRGVLHKAFNLSQSEIPRFNHSWSESFTIVCTPEQFTKFLILREDRGVSNLFRELNVKIVEYITHKANQIYVGG